MFQLQYYIAFAGAWALGNGLLHDGFILAQKRPFDKELIRLLIDGHILIFAGIFYLMCFTGIKNGQTWAFYFAIATSIFLLGYCGLIFKMLPSIVTILINLTALIWLIVKLKN
jgi:hypothetical protein